MAMYFDESVSDKTLRKHFEAAKRNGVRYIGVMQQIFEDPYAVTCDQTVISAHECEDIVRQVREQGLRPHAPHTTLFRLMDTRERYNAQVEIAALDSLAQNFTPAAKDAYSRYLDARNDMARTPKKSWFGKFLGR